MYKEMLRATSQKMVPKKCSSGMEADNLLGYVSRPQATQLFSGNSPDPRACFTLPNPDPQWLSGLGQGPDPKLGQPKFLF